MSLLLLVYVAVVVVVQASAGWVILSDSQGLPDSPWTPERLLAIQAGLLAIALAATLLLAA